MAMIAQGGGIMATENGERADGEAVRKMSGPLRARTPNGPGEIGRTLLSSPHLRGRGKGMQEQNREICGTVERG